ncbi:unnamed protein product [Rotaria socialis]|uniref:Uncharacterized protein n=1 Tax=Rotaria socialis TaxID=392032 RepID=A0A821DB37_9BILA|nr:unnamed protein product [Rotaria socialis]CAF4618970.1 unnamed protein product [Rotaria socialis]
MNKKQIELFDFWNKSRNLSLATTTNVSLSCENQQEISSIPSDTTDSIPLYTLDEPVKEVETASTESRCSSSHIPENQQVSSLIENEDSNMLQTNKKPSTPNCRNYLSSW